MWRFGSVQKLLHTALSPLCSSQFESEWSVLASVTFEWPPTTVVCYPGSNAIIFLCLALGLECQLIVHIFCPMAFFSRGSPNAVMWSAHGPNLYICEYFKFVKVNSHVWMLLLTTLSSYTNHSVLHYSMCFISLPQFKYISEQFLQLLCVTNRSFTIIFLSTSCKKKVPYNITQCLLFQINCARGTLNFSVTSYMLH